MVGQPCSTKCSENGLLPARCSAFLGYGVVPIFLLQNGGWSSGHHFYFSASKMRVKKMRAKGTCSLFFVEVSQKLPYTVKNHLIPWYNLKTPHWTFMLLKKTPNTLIINYQSLEPNFSLPKNTKYFGIISTYVEFSAMLLP